VTPPAFLTNYPYVRGVTAGSAQLHVAANEPSYVHYAVVVTGAVAPDVAAVVAGTVTDAIKTGWMHYDAVTLALGRERVVNIVGLTPHTTYDVHVAAKDTAQDNAQTAIVTVTLTTSQPPYDENLYREYCRGLSDDTLGYMVGGAGAVQLLSSTALTLSLIAPPGDPTLPVNP
jgi:hypothetical protein